MANNRAGMNKTKFKMRQAAGLGQHADHLAKAVMVPDWGRYQERGPDDSDREERNKGWGGRRLSAAFYSVLGPSPVCRPGDHQTARNYLRNIQKVQAMAGWTKSERVRLKKLEDKWRLRAEGRSTHFELHGTKRQWADHSSSTTHQQTNHEIMYRVRTIQEMVRADMAGSDKVKKVTKGKLGGAAPRPRKPTNAELSLAQIKRLEQCQDQVLDGDADLIGLD